MAARFFYVDVHFFHKNTARILLDELGPWGPLMWLALIAQGKNHRPGGEFTWTSETDALQQLFGSEVDPSDVPFTFEEFLKITGRLKQTRRAKTDRRRRGRVANVALTGWERWQKESRTWSERERKTRKRTESPADTERKASGHAADTTRTKTASSSRTTTTPKPPSEKNGNHPDLACPICGAVQRNRSELEDHLEYVHPEPEPASPTIPGLT